jgi:hypothetical protein
MKLQYASDLHIDEWPQSTNFCTFLTPSAPNLALAGDICPAWDPRYEAFLGWCSRLWHTVFVVTGNHEYHNAAGKTIIETNNHIFAICLKFRNVIFLQDGASYTFPGTKIRIIGATLWSLSDHVMWAQAIEKKSDYKNIYGDLCAETKLVHPSEIVRIHISQINALRYALTPRFCDEQLIVITHHMPSKSLLEREFRGEMWHSFYASDADFLFNPFIKAWICGHSHRATLQRTRMGPLLAMNARGYNRAHELTRSIDMYNPCAALSI